MNQISDCAKSTALVPITSSNVGGPDREAARFAVPALFTDSSRPRFGGQTGTQTSHDSSPFGGAFNTTSGKEFRTAAVLYGLFAFCGIVANWLTDHYLSDLPSYDIWETAVDVAVAVLMGGLLFYFVRRGVVATRQGVERLQAFFDSSGDGVFLTDVKTGVFIDVNNAGCGMFGYAANELIGMTIGEISSGVPPHTQRDALHILRTGNDGEKQLLTWHCKAKDGRLFWVEISTRNATVEGRAVGIAMLRDITARIEAEREAAESKRVFEDLFQNAEIAILDMNFTDMFDFVQQAKQAGVTNIGDYVLADEGRVAALPGLVHVNRMNGEAQRLAGSMAAPSTDDVSRPQDISLFVKIAEAIFRGDAKVRSEMEIRLANGESLSVLSTSPIPHTREDALRVPQVILDLSQLKLAETANQANAAKSQFLASMSHEIRTPLNGVIGNLELLALSSPNAEQFEMIEQAEKAAKALMALIGNILDFSKIEQGKLAIEMGDVNPSSLAEEAVAVLQTRARQKHIFVTSTVDQDVPDVVWSDGARLRQILLNLVGNSVKFTHEGSVALRVSVAHWDGDTCELKFIVHDSGRGFDQARAELLFQPFVQDKVAIDTSEGTGLGLSICRKLVEALGGSMGCEGVPEEGSTFWFTLPVRVTKRVSQIQRPNLTNCKIAVVVDDVPGAQPLKDYFRARGASVVRVKNIAEAITALEPVPGEMLKSRAILVRSADSYSPPISDLRAKHIVPIMYGSDGSFHANRVALRAGFSTVIATGEGPSHLDRNIHALLGHVPHQEPENTFAQLATQPILSLQNKHILVLEDRVVNQLVIQKQLAKLNVQFTLAADGLKGLAAMEFQHFDLILCDCSMPNMNGYDFTRTVRACEKADGATRHIPIIALTANAFREDVDKCLQAGMDDFISKPVNLERLGEALGKWLAPTPSTPMPRRADLATDAPAIDLSSLEDLLGAGEQEMLNEILAEFAVAARQSAASLEAAVASGRLNGILVMAHGAKGEARSAGAVQLGDLYAEMERQAKTGDARGCEAIQTRIAAEVDRVDAFIADRLASSLPAGNSPSP